MRSILATALLSTLVAAGCAAPVSDSSGDDTGDTGEAADALLIITGPMVARFDIKWPSGGDLGSGCSFDDVDLEMKKSIRDSLIGYFPNVDVVSVCAADNSRRYGVWETVGTATVEGARANTLLSAASLRVGSENFAAQFTPRLMNDAVEKVWAGIVGQPMTITGTWWAVGSSFTPKSHTPVSFLPGATEMSITGTAVINPLGFGWVSVDYTVLDHDDFSLAANPFETTSCGRTINSVQCLQADTGDEGVPSVGCPFADALPKQVLSPFWMTKYVWNYSRLAINPTSGILSGATMTVCDGMPSMSASTPYHPLVIDHFEVPVVSVPVTVDTVDLLPPIKLTYTWQGKTLVRTVDTTTDTANLAVTIPAGTFSAVTINVAATDKKFQQVSTSTTANFKMPAL